MEFFQLSNSELIIVMLQELIDQIESHKEFTSDREPCFLSLYLVERAYGGPEEGGWYYDVRVLQGGIPFTSRTEAAKWLEEAEAKAEAQTREEIDPYRARRYEELGDDETVTSSCPEGYIPRGWSDGGNYRVMIEKSLGDNDTSNQPTPYYE